MDTNVCKELISFTQRYLDLWQATHHHWPKSETLFGMDSNCLTQLDHNSIYWKPVQRPHLADFVAAEVAAKRQFHPSVKAFFGTQFAGDMLASFQGTSFWLLQMWSDADFVRLLQNQIAHVSMQKQLKRPPTFFLGTLEDGTELLSLHGETGYIGIENLIDGSHTCLAPSLEIFLRQLKPECNA